LRIGYIEVRSALSRSGLPDIDYALNPYAGCAHGCIYCYARLYTRPRDAAENWGSMVYVKRNLIEVLRREVKRFRRGVVGVGTITDPYQPIEVREVLTRRAIELLLENGFAVSIQTKSPLILRDLDILRSHPGRVDVGFTITSLDPEKARFIEPRAPDPRSRAAALKRIADACVETWIFLGPVIPGINSSMDEVVRIVELAAETGSKLLVDKLHVKRFMWGGPLEAYARRALRYPWRRFFEDVLRLCRDYGVRCIEGLAEPSEERSRGLATLDRYMR